MPAFYMNDLAYVHDVGFRAVPEEAAAWLVAYLDRHKVPDGAIVDLGCGSGVFAATVLRTGRPVLGIDVSAGMIRLARRAAPRARFRRASIYREKIPDCAIVTSIGEGLNYLPPQGRMPALPATFGRIRERLCHGGLFVFDVITGPVAKLVPGHVFRTGRDWAVLSETRETRTTDRLERHITTFRGLNGRYRRSEEVHLIQVFGRARVLEALRGAGFSARSLKSYGPRARLAGRTVFVARKR